MGNAASRLNRPARHPAAIGTVAVLHVAVGYALLNGMAQRVVERLQEPIETKVLDAPKEPPPPLPPPEALPVDLLPPPPPAFVPPPEVRIKPPPPAPRIVAIAPLPPPPAPMAPVARAPVVSVPPAPPARLRPPTPAPVPAPPRLAQPARLDMSRCEKPIYPRNATRAGATGTTRIRFSIDGAGRVVRAELTKPSGVSSEHRSLDRAAIAALSQCAFKPGIDQNGRPMGASTTVEYVWRLED